MSISTSKDFEVSEFNVLRGNVSDNRQSRDKTVVDTNEGLSTDTGVLSQAQDSNYSLESWTRGRYAGTEQKYKIGDNPSVSLTPIRIAVFSKETENKAIRDRLNSDARSPEFTTGYFATYIREIPVKSIPTPEFGTITATVNSLEIFIETKNDTDKEVTTEIRNINGEWIRLATSATDDTIEKSFTELPSGTEFTFQIRNTMLVPGFDLISQTVTKTESTRVRTVTATFNSAGGSFIPQVSGPVPLKVPVPNQTTRSGFEFVYWEPSVPTIITENTTFRANWNPVTNNPSDPDCLYITNFGAGLDPCFGGLGDTFLTAGVTLSALADQEYEITLEIRLAGPGVGCPGENTIVETITILSGSQFGEIDCDNAESFDEGTQICNVDIFNINPPLPLTNPCLNTSSSGNGEGTSNPDNNETNTDPEEDLN